MTKSVDIIVPVYNGENTISRCLDSLLAQKYSGQLTIIVVDDGSTDNTGIIINKYMNIFDNIFLIKSGNRGVSNARNLGLDYSTAEYICFVDSDDYVSDNYISTLTKYMTEDIDAVISEAIDVDSSGNVLGGRLSSTVWIGSIDNNFNPESWYSHFTVWGCLFKRALIKNLRFEILFRVGEDTLFLFEALRLSRRFVHIPFMGYYYVKNMNSITNTKTEKEAFDEFQAWLKIADLFRNFPKLFHLLRGSAILRISRSIFHLDFRTVDKKIIKSIYSYYSLSLIYDGIKLCFIEKKISYLIFIVIASLRIFCKR